MCQSIRTLPKSWSSTLSLPKSTFPPRAIITDRLQYLKNCSDDLYNWQKHQRKNAQSFILQDGPPYANGGLHVGHALNKILKDITCRYHLSQGKNVTWIPGWDCHGLPIELKALQNQRDLELLGIDERPGPDFVRKAARQLAMKTVNEQKRSFREWAIMADWENAWMTMDHQFESKQLKVFIELLKKGFIYRSFRPVYWSPSSRTALAEAELEYNDEHTSVAAFVKYPLDQSSQKLQNIAKQLGLDSGTISAVIWTTTPWTLPANKAIGIHSGIEYAVVDSNKHGLLLLAKSQVAKVQVACEETFQILFSVFGSELLGETYQDCGFRNASSSRQLLHADFVSAETGTGLVHLAPGHGADDYELCRKHDLPAFAPVDDEGRFTSLASPGQPEMLSGKDVLTTGNQTIIEFLRERRSLLGCHMYKHNYPYDWRSKRPIIVRATEQWFADVGGIRKGAIQSLNFAKFIPSRAKGRLEKFIENRSEWCISRQRAWGLPIPALYNIKTGEAILTEASVSHIISVIQERGIDSWWTDHEQELSWVPDWLRNDAGPLIYRRGKDTLDVWFDSGTSWTQTTGYGSAAEKHVADVYLEGTDQHRGWFQSSLLTYVAQQGDVKTVRPMAPFRTLVTHGFVLDQQGHKMSKSLGNVILPEEIMQGTLLPPLKKKHRLQGPVNTNLDGKVFDSLGPDALRLWVASCDYTKDVAVSQTVLKSVNAYLSKYRVTFKLLLGILGDFLPQNTIPFVELDTNHQIALLQLQDVESNTRTHYENFDYYKVISEINNYISNDFSAFYMETIKDVLYAGCKKCPTVSSRKMAQHTLLQIFSSLQQMLAPVTPLLIEEVWAYTPSQIREFYGYPFHRVWKLGDRCNVSWQNDQLRMDLPYLLQANAAVKRAQERARCAKRIGSSLQSLVVLRFNKILENVEDIGLELFKRYQGDLDTLFVVSKVEICAGSLPSSASTAEWSYEDEFDIGGSKVSIHVYPPQEAKCVRCWKYTASPEPSDQILLCDRCEEVVGELRTQRPDIFEENAPNGIAAAAA